MRFERERETHSPFANMCREDRDDYLCDYFVVVCQIVLFSFVMAALLVWMFPDMSPQDLLDVPETLANFLNRGIFIEENKEFLISLFNFSN